MTIQTKATEQCTLSKHLSVCLYLRILTKYTFFSQFPLLGLTSSVLFINISPIGPAPIFIWIIDALDSLKGITMNLPK